MTLLAPVAAILVLFLVILPLFVVSDKDDR